MPIIAIEEDCDEVCRLLSSVPDVESSATISIETPVKELEDEFCHQETSNYNQRKSGDVVSFSKPPSDYTSFGGINPSSTNSHDRNARTIIFGNMMAEHDVGNKIDVANDGVDSLGSTFELCSISSFADPLSLSISRSKKSIDRSIGKSTSSRHKYVMIRKTSSNQMQLNRSIGSSTSSNRKVGCSSMNQSTHSTASKLAEVVVVPKTESIDNKYFIDHSREIGRGTNTIVRKCIERSTGNRYAVKSVRRTDTDEYEHMRKEVNLLTALHHPSIIQIYDTYEDEKYLHMVIEICKGGELYDHVVNPPRNKNNRNEGLSGTSEEVAAVIVRRVVDAVSYLHEHNIVHRDLKLENLLFKTKPNTKNKQSLTDVRVIDFGLSRRYNTHHRFVSLKKLTSFVGTKFYVAPEVLNKSYTHAVDVWSIGVLAYALLSTKAPFSGRNDQELFDKIQSCGKELKFPSPDFDNVSEMAKGFIRQLLVKNEASRPTANELLSHPWMMQALRWKDEIESAPSAGRGDFKTSVVRKLFGRLKKSKNGRRTKVASPVANKHDDLDGVSHKKSSNTLENSD